jgi:hypothetical protein
MKVTYFIIASLLMASALADTPAPTEPPICPVISSELKTKFVECLETRFFFKGIISSKICESPELTWFGSSIYTRITKKEQDINLRNYNIASTGFAYQRRAAVSSIT